MRIQKSTLLEIAVIALPAPARTSLLILKVGIDVSDTFWGNDNKINAFIKLSK